MREILRYKRNGKLLEIGCAEGEFLLTAKKYFDVWGIDIGDYALGVAKKALGKRVEKKDIMKQELAREEFDVIVVFNLLEHMKQPRHVINKIYEALRNTGILIGSVPNNSGVIGALSTRVSNVTDRTHCSTLPPRLWRSYFREAGFRKIRFFGEIVPQRGTSMYVKNQFWNLVSSNLVFVCEK